MNNYQTIYNEVGKLFESEQQSPVVFNISGTSPLEIITKEQMMQHVVNPLTGDYYDGIYLYGEFASIGVLNNNNRIYLKEPYLELIEYLREQIHGVGVYGELEHPKKYPVDYNNVSHKIVDIWYDEATDKVMGIIVLLNNTRAGINAQEIVKSGGKLGLSARGGGEEFENADGTITAFLKLLVTFDIVSLPGFTTARQNFIGQADIEQALIGMYFPNGSKLNPKVKEIDYTEYTQLNESQQEPSKPKQQQQKGQSPSQQQQETQVLQDGDDQTEQKLQKQLQQNVQKTLNEGIQNVENLVKKPFTPYYGGVSDAYIGGGYDPISQSQKEFEEFLEDIK